MSGGLCGEQHSCIVECLVFGSDPESEFCVEQGFDDIGLEGCCFVRSCGFWFLDQGGGLEHLGFDT